jgi:heparin binding hemagglutinin HbhA
MTTETTETTERKIPNSLYAAAGVGDLAYQQLRKIPGKVAELPAKVAELRGKVEANEATRVKVDVDKLRAAARRNAEALRTGALAAQDKAEAVYADLVARGQQVVRAGRSAGSDRVEKLAEVTSDAAVAIAPESTTPADAPEAVAPEAVAPQTVAKPKKAAPKK